MGLVGSLDDLPLEDILQLVGLSRRSGVLRVHGEGGRGWILLSEGRVQAAGLEGGPPDLRALLRSAGWPPDAVGDDALHERLRRESAVKSALFMLGWQRGGYRLEVGAQHPVPGLADLRLADGIDVQFLAMECVRIRDEARRAKQPEADGGSSAGEPVGSRQDEPRGAPVALAPDTPVVVIDPDLSALDWVKSAAGEGFGRVHAFQRSEEGVARVWRYLMRGRTPLVILSPALSADSISGARDARELTARLKAQAPHMPVLLLDAPICGGPTSEVRTSDLPTDGPSPPGMADGWVAKPSPGSGERAAEALAAALRLALEAWGRPTP